MAAGITRKKPPELLTVEEQYFCFNEQDASTGDWTTTFDEEVIEYPTVVDVTVTENADAWTDWASGQDYASESLISYADLETSNIAVDDAMIERLRGNTVDGGVVLGGGAANRPYFAYGISKLNADGTRDMRWYPKCKLVESDDTAQTSGESHSVQELGLTVRAFGFNDHQDKYVRVLTSESAMARMTKAAFFAAPLLTKADVVAALPSSGG